MSSDSTLERFLDQLRRIAPPPVELYPIQIPPLSFGCAHLPGSVFLLHSPERPRSRDQRPRSRSDLLPKCDQTQGAVVVRTMAPSKVSKLSETARQGCCKFCGEPEEDGKRFLICSHPPCMYKYYHIRCMSPDQIASENQVEERCWYCPSCLCRVCHEDNDTKRIILCDGCDEAYHLSCLNPPRTRVPKGKWYCKVCIQARARQEKVKEYEEMLLLKYRKHDLTMVKSNKCTGLERLLSRVKKLRADDEAEAVKTLEMLKGGNEAASTAAE